MRVKESIRAAFEFAATPFDKARDDFSKLSTNEKRSLAVAAVLTTNVVAYTLGLSHGETNASPVPQAEVTTPTLAPNLTNTLEDSVNQEWIEDVTACLRANSWPELRHEPTPPHAPVVDEFVAACVQADYDPGQAKVFIPEADFEDISPEEWNKMFPPLDPPTTEVIWEI